MNDLNKKIKILDIQTIGSILLIISVIVTLVLTYNQKKYTLHAKPIFDRKTTYIISNSNRVFALIIVLLFLYSSYQLREIAKKKNSDIKLNDLDVTASILSVISAIIALYITAKSPIENALSIENPNI